MTQKPGGKGNEFVRALFDMVVLILLLVATGFGGYWWGTNQRLAPLQNVPPGTPGALPAPVSASLPTGKTDSKPTNSTASTAAVTKTEGKRKYWIASSGDDYIGSTITVNVNDEPVDSFFGPGKTVDITGKVKSGKNTITFDSKALGKEYNKHKGDGDAVLTLQVVSGPHVQDTFKDSDVVATFKRTALDTEDASQSLNFVGD